MHGLGHVRVLMSWCQGGVHSYPSLSRSAWSRSNLATWSSASRIASSHATNNSDNAPTYQESKAERTRRSSEDPGSVTYMRSILLYESCSAFFEGCGELDVLSVSFNERSDAGLESLIICGADGISGFDTGKGRDTHWSAFRLWRRPSGRVPRFRACRDLRLGYLVPSPEGRFRTLMGSCSHRRAWHLG